MPNFFFLLILSLNTATMIAKPTTIKQTTTKQTTTTKPTKPTTPTTTIDKTSTTTEIITTTLTVILATEIHTTSIIKTPIFTSISNIAVSTDENEKCKNATCLNGGVCSKVTNLCTCTALYTGNNCENAGPLIALCVVLSACFLVIIVLVVVLTFFRNGIFKLKSNNAQPNGQQIKYEETIPNEYVDAIKIDEINQTYMSEINDIYSHIQSKAPIPLIETDYD